MDIVSTVPERVGARRRIAELVRQLDATPIGQELRDAGRWHRSIYAALTGHPDPVLREIGRQLVDGRLRPRDILASPVYTDALQAAAERAADRLDPVVIAGELAVLSGGDRTGRIR